VWHCDWSVEQLYFVTLARIIHVSFSLFFFFFFAFVHGAYPPKISNRLC
jgi:hypothetical protein